MTEARRVDVPDEARALSTVLDPNYSYACARARPAGDTRSAEQWMRAATEGAPPLLRWFIVSGWRFGLGLRLAPRPPRPSPDHVLGWTIARNEPDGIVLAVESWLLQPQLVLQLEDELVVHATFIHYRHPLARVVWPVASLLHHVIIPAMLNRASRSAG